MNIANKSAWIVGAVSVVIGLGAGYVYGNSQAVTSYQSGFKSGRDSGYQEAIAAAKTTQEEVARKATEQAAQAANPFRTENPLEGVTANPFEDAAKKLNPFAE